MLLHFLFAVKEKRMLKYHLLAMEELPPNPGSNLLDLAKELYRTGLDCRDKGKFMQGIEALERSLATYQQLTNKGPEDYLHERFQVWFNLGKYYRTMKRTQEAIWSFGESLKIVRQLSATHPDYYLRWVAMTLVEFASPIMISDKKRKPKPSVWKQSTSIASWVPTSWLIWARSGCN
jgi:tetratricopeptide (TPR) repeat protein